MTITEYVAYLDQMGAKLRTRVMEAQREATVAAVETATKETAPNDGIPRGSNMVTGNMARRWAADSKTEPVDEGTKMTTELNNSSPYASFVNHGHWLYRHFVPGLYIDESGLLSRDLTGGHGLIVAKEGQKWVPGRYMEDKALAEYRRVLHAELSKVGDIWK